jgi:hypothetical protein
MELLELIALRSFILPWWKLPNRYVTWCFRGSYYAVESRGVCCHLKQLNLMKSNPSKTNHIFSFFLDWPEDTDSLFRILTTIKYMKHTYRHKYSVCQNYNSINVFFY